MLIDSHCHLFGDTGGKSADTLVAEAHAAGVETLVCVATELANLDLAREIAERHPRVFHTAGVHPHEAKDLTPGDIEKIRAAAKYPKCVAIGEIGLDYYYNHSDRESQRRALKAQLDLAVELKLPVVIHARDAEEDLNEMLSAYAKEQTLEIPGVIHCFTGTRDFGLKCIDLGFMISFSGILTFKTAEDLRASAKLFPLDRLMVETDSPYLAPIPHRGKKCEPQMVRLTAQKLAEVRGTSLDEIAQVTSANTRRAFNI